MADFPTSLPVPRWPNYKLKPVEPVERTDMEKGSMRSRRRTSARNDQVQLSFHFSDAEMQTFRDWFDNATTGADGGAAWFNIDLPIGNTGLDAVEAKFVKIWNADQKAGLRWIVNAVLEVR